jgi:hypothetical protein
MLIRRSCVFLGLVGLVVLMSTSVLGGATDGRGYVWRPSGTYTGPCIATFGTVAEFAQGNACAVTGRVEQEGNTNLFHFVVTNRDGIDCSADFGGGVITIVDGPAVRADGNASRFDFSPDDHSFCMGSYSYDFSAD